MAAGAHQVPPGPAAVPNLVLRAASKAFAGRPVWAPVDLVVESATLTVVTGPNGAGKTTLLRLVAGLLQPTTGSRTCAGSALYVRGGGGLRGVLTADQAVATAARLAARGPLAATGALHLLGATDLGERRVGTLSAGERVRVALAAAAAAAPALLCLDEPTAALDDEALGALTTALAALRSAGCSLLVATHQPASLLPHADAHLRVDDGRIFAA